MKKATAQAVKKNKIQILENWMKFQLTDEGLRDDLMNNEELHAQSVLLLDALIRAMETGETLHASSREFDPIRDVLGEISVMRARRGYSPRETASFVLSLKQSLFDAIEKEYKKEPESLYKEIIAVNNILDALSIFTFEAFLKGREEIILRQTDEINEISTPVIRVWEGILALPIIGTLDSARTQIVMENLLQEIVATNSSIAILDISGVPAVDSLVAQHLIKTVSATRLMGAECIISGIRAEIAQTIVHLGIDLSNIKTKASLASALRVAFDMMNVEVKKVDRRSNILLK
ncbi:STAS domain-containing protein [Adhaeribacter sp. BT258]|uniref:STAS domain-containing protein n=1 Tax=Adhaeribacter terrigena TaxID=2793070 RepID=A0ABS1BYV9_9BACT|nr:STAS domain-containing protein [Adhaeribacter terrigena]MBK0402355.1 STAS domain-containing protein [Adhaeribacter terrigena]